jgi:hypothetical protein
LYGATADDKIQEYSPQVECDSNIEIEPEEALKDFNKGDDQ